MAFDLNEFDEFEGFEEVSGFSGGAEVTLVAGVKLVLHGSAITHLGISKEDLGRENGQSRAQIKINKAGKQLMIVKVPDTSQGIVFGGKMSAVELYSAKIAKAILDGIGKKLKGSGTIGFPEVRKEKGKKGTPFLLIDFSQYTANDGVFADEEEAEAA